jgi:pimeloyl-ACP methyl ester carboxylesterase
MAWYDIANSLHDEGYDIIAPDLRGRGASSSVRGGYGLKAHENDLRQIINYFSSKPVTLVGHSMGAYIGVQFAVNFPEYLERLILVDGGIALPRPLDVEPEAYLLKTLGPALDRLSLEFDDREAYFNFWRAHPSFSDPTNWSEGVEHFLDYDLEPAKSGRFKSRVAKDAVFKDGGELMAARMVTLIDKVKAPMLLLTAERGLLNQEKPMLPVAAVKEKVTLLDHLAWQEIPNTNHYSITLSTGIVPVSVAIQDFCDSNE